MNSQTSATSASDALIDRQERSEIDASCKIPVLLFFGTAILWLLIGTLFALTASIKLHSPSFVADWAASTFGRVRPAHLNAVIYGWASLAGIGTSIWLMARLCRTKLRGQKVIIAAGLLWNVGVALGVFGILAGHSLSIEWLEFPAYAAITLFVAFALISVWGIDMFINRKPGHVYVSQWYILAALFWFPWLYSTVQILLVLFPVQGSTQAIINWWFAHNVLGLWFTPIGLASAYYMIPKVTGRPIHSYYLSILGFWSLALFYSWNGGHHLIGGPIPSWIVSASIVASIMMFVPVITVAINHHMTMKGHFHMLKTSPTLRFTVFGAMCYTVASLQGSTMAIRSLNKLTHFTDYTIGHAHIGLYSFFTMAMFGAIYYIVPRLIGWEWPSASLIRIHFWSTAIGSLLMFGVLTVGGVIQGYGLESKQGYDLIIASVAPYKIARSVAGTMMGIGHIAFAISFTLMLLKIGSHKTDPTLFIDPAKQEVA